MDICIPKLLTLTGTENLSWMTDNEFNPLSLTRCKEVLCQKRHRQGTDYTGNLISRIQNWVDGPIDEHECSTSQSTSNSSLLQLSLKDSGIGINSPLQKEDGFMSNLIMPDSRSEECEKPSLKVKRRRLSFSEDLVSKIKLDLINSERMSRKESKNCISNTLRNPPEAISKRYTLISNINENRPLVIKLKACPLEPETSADNASEAAGIKSRIQTEVTDITSTVQPSVVMSYDDTLHNRKPCPSHKSLHMPLHKVRNVSTVVSSTTRCNQERIIIPKDMNIELSTANNSDAKTEQNNKCTISVDSKFPQNLISVDNKTICQDTKYLDDHKAMLKQTILASNQRFQAAIKQHEKQISSIIMLSSDIRCNKLSNCETVAGAVTSSSCGAVGGVKGKSYCEKFSKENIHLKRASKDKKATGELTKSARPLVQSSHHLPTSFQVSRRYARIFRRSTLVPQLHQQTMKPNTYMLAEDHERQCDEFVNDVCETFLCSTFNEPENLKVSVSNDRRHETELYIDEMENEVLLNEMCCDLSEVDLLNQEENEGMPNNLCKSFLNDTERNGGVLFDEILFQIPAAGSLLMDNFHYSRIIPGDLYSDLPSINLSVEDLFISDQKQLIQLRHDVFCLIRTLVPQLHMPDRFDSGGRAVDELVDVVCGELNDSEKEHGRTIIHSGRHQNVCLNSSVELCRTPGDCLSRLRCKVLTMLRLLLGIDLNEFDNENHLHSLLDTIVSANYHDEELFSCEFQPLSTAGIPMCFATCEFSTKANISLNTINEAVEEASSNDSFSDIPELLVESERKFVHGDMDDFPEPPRLTAVDERYCCQ